jgi:FkbM family methyltransferase
MAKTIYHNHELQKELASALRQLNSNFVHESYDILVSPNEINNQHGVGFLVQRIFPNSDNFFSIRSRDLYSGDHCFGKRDFCLSMRDSSFFAIANIIQEQLNIFSPKRLLSIPYFPEDYLISIAIKILYDCPLCVFIMDDQNIFSKNVPDSLVEELIDKADLCLGISPPLCNAYQEKFKKKFWFVPPVIENHLIQNKLELISSNKLPQRQGILIGNIWSQNWLDQLRLLCKTAKVTIDWYGNPNREWIRFDDRELEIDGISFKGFLPENELIKKLRESCFAIIPTGSSENAEDRPELTKLSLPSRSCFITATANLPILVVGDSNSAVAQFVREYDLGVVCNYDVDDFLQKVNYLCQSENRQKIRQNAFKIGQNLGVDNLAAWIWDSLEKKEATDLRFESLLQQSPVRNTSVVMTACEVTQRHGTGALVRRVFPTDSGIISVRCENNYGGEHNFGIQSYYLPQREWDRKSVFTNISSVLSGQDIGRVFCVPYYSENLLAAIAIKEFFGVPMGTWIMDDQNICVNNIPDDLMKEFLSKCDIRFATHPELRDAYENKYGLKFWLLPAVVPDHLITSVISTPTPEKYQQRTGILIGSIWSRQWFNSLCESVAGAGVKLDWFGNSQYYWLTESEDELQAKGIYPQGLSPEGKLAETLKDYPFVVVPTGTLDERDDQPQLSQLSLPGRILFALATSNTPVILLGSPRTSAANFINRFKIGTVCDYTPESFKAAVDYVLDLDNQKMMRENAVKVAKAFSDKGIDDWIWQSLADRQAADSRFESILPRSPIDLVHFIEPPVPSIIYKDYAQVYQVMRRLKGQNYHPDFVVDVGASHGIWSHTASQLFPEAQFILIDPLISRYEQAARNYYIRNIPKAELLEIAVSNQAGLLSFQVSPDLYGSSLLTPADFREYETVTVEVKTLDQVAVEKNLSGRGILKLDVQCAEHIVLEGAKIFLEQVDLVVAELSFIRYDEKALVFLEMLNLLHELDFRYYDETGEWRSQIDGTLLQKEVVFIRQDLLIPETSRKI